jgi:hypothetical protein
LKRAGRIFPLYHLHLHRSFYALLYAVTPRKYGSPYPFYKAQKNSSKVKGNFSCPARLSAYDARSLQRQTLKNTRFFIAFI